MCLSCRDPSHRPDLPVLDLSQEVARQTSPTRLQLGIAEAYGVDFTPATAKSTAENLRSYGRRDLARVVQAYADVVIQNANIHTMNPEQPAAEALTVKKNQIDLVGTNEEAAAQIGPNTRVIDAKGKTITPGFQDAHAHLLYIVELHSWTPVRGLSKAEMIAAIQKAEPIGGWIKCFGEVLSRDEIDAALRAVGKENIPVYMEGSTGEWSSVNTAALERIEAFHGIDLEGPHDPAKLKGGHLPVDGHGWVELDASRRPTGRLRYANVLVHAAKDGKSEGPMPAATYDDIKDHFAKALEYFGKNGITQFQNAMSTLPELEIYKRYEEERGLPMRIYSSHGMSQFKIHTEVDGEFLERMAGLRSEYNSDLFNVGGVKFNVSPVAGESSGGEGSKALLGFLRRAYDGMPSSARRTLLQLRQGFNAISFGLSGPPAKAAAPRGLSYSLEEFTAFIKLLNEAGLQAWIHAIGRDEIELCLQAFAAADPEGKHGHLRHRIEHFSMATPDQAERAAKLGVAAAVQPEWGFPAGAARKEGMVTGLGTDWDVIADINPLRQMAAAMAQGLTAREAVERYTVHGAIVSHSEDRLGMIQPGKLADLVMLDRDIVEATSPREVERAKVLMTMVDGKIVHGDPGDEPKAP
ncbi:MAG: amidohydrolase family protein [Deltaproteobacteria bacterium]|nr:amidohydrolase family protein [Deltaproteobacteria bacterium]